MKKIDIRKQEIAQESVDGDILFETGPSKLRGDFVGSNLNPKETRLNNVMYGNSNDSMNAVAEC